MFILRQAAVGGRGPHHPRAGCVHLYPLHRPVPQRSHALARPEMTNDNSERRPNKCAQMHKRPSAFPALAGGLLCLLAAAPAVNSADSQLRLSLRSRDKVREGAEGRSVTETNAAWEARKTALVI